LSEEPVAAYEPEGGYGDGAVVAQDFMSAARAMGVEYMPKVAVNSISVENGRVRGVNTSVGEIHAGAVLLATGPWTLALVKPLGIDLPIAPEFHQVAILRNPPGLKGAGSACIDSTYTMYFRSDGSDKTLVGDFYGERGAVADPDHFAQRPSEEWIEAVLERASGRIPKLQTAEVMRGITGIYDMTPDARPLLGELSGVGGLYIAAGFSGTGFKIAPAIGLVMSELQLDGASKTVDISAFRPTRFQEGKPIKGEFEYVYD
jgi:glycine/D-amino acid oxidase-like deaminating enzyme